MLVTKRSEILINADPEQIWDFVNDPAHWMASNPEEHYGTEFLTRTRRSGREVASTNANRLRGCVPT